MLTAGTSRSHVPPSMACVSLRPTGACPIPPGTEGSNPSKGLGLQKQDKRGPSPTVGIEIGVPVG